jgi:hypothetical protein
MILDGLCIQNAYPDPVEERRRQEAESRAIARQRAAKLHQTKSLEPIDGYENKLVQTELYLEELTDRVEELEMECQTDAILDRPPSPFFVPAKTGVDVAAQIYEGDVGTHFTLNVFFTDLAALNFLS